MLRTTGLTRTGVATRSGSGCCAAVPTPGPDPGSGNPDAARETVLDRRVHIEKDLRDIPRLPPLCDGLAVEKRRIDVGAAQLYCETEGEGTPLVLINGGPGGTHHGFHPWFGRAAAFARVVYYDQRGCGRSDYQPGSGYSIDQAVGDLERLRAALKLDRWVVLGWSYGAVPAQLYTLRHPERVAGLVLVGSTPAGFDLTLGPTRQHDVLTPEEVARIREIYNTPALPVDKAVFNGHLNGDWKRQSFYKPTLEQLARMALYEWKHDRGFRSRICSQVGRLNLNGTFDGCPVPTLLLEGRCDLTWSSDKAAKFCACHPGARRVMFERSAHAPFMDEPVAFFRALEDFMAALPEARAE